VRARCAQEFEEQELEVLELLELPTEIEIELEEQPK